jgi:hypothetical protein
MNTRKARAGAALSTAFVLMTLSAASAQADSISVTTGSDPTEEVPLPITATWSSGDPGPQVLVTVKPSGPQGCAVNYSADAANSDTIIGHDGVASGSWSVNQTFRDPGTFTLCGYLQHSTSDTSPLAATGPVAVTVRAGRATVAIAAPARVSPRKTFALIANVTAELPRELLVTAKRAGGRGCEATYALDAPNSETLVSTDVQGTQTVKRTAEASSTRGTYLLCAYVQETTSDPSPEAVGSTQFVVGPDPCTAAKAVVTKVRKALSSAKRTEKRRKATWNRLQHGHHRAAARRARARYRRAARRRARIAALLVSKKAEATTACSQPSG